MRRGLGRGCPSTRSLVVDTLRPPPTLCRGLLEGCPPLQRARSSRRVEVGNHRRGRFPGLLDIRGRSMWAWPGRLSGDRGEPGSGDGERGQPSAAEGQTAPAGPARSPGPNPKPNAQNTLQQHTGGSGLRQVTDGAIRRG
jgi:hypothetical protein